MNHWTVCCRFLTVYIYNVRGSHMTVFALYVFKNLNLFGGWVKFSPTNFLSWNCTSARKKNLLLMYVKKPLFFMLFFMKSVVIKSFQHFSNRYVFCLKRLSVFWCKCKQRILSIFLIISHFADGRNFLNYSHNKNDIWIEWNVFRISVYIITFLKLHNTGKYKNFN